MMAPPLVRLPSPVVYLALLAVEAAARAYASHTHGNLGSRAAYLAREEARDDLRDALAGLDKARGG